MGWVLHTQSYANDRGRVRCRYTNQFISRCDDLIESMSGEGLCMYIGRVPTACNAALAITDPTYAITRALEEQHYAPCADFTGADKAAVAV